MDVMRQSAGAWLNPFGGDNADSTPTLRCSSVETATSAAVTTYSGDGGCPIRRNA
jgi:hypothetical protein